jgi:hypothetical protein
MPKNKFVGSGLTRREELFHSIDEIEGLSWPTIFDELKKTKAVAIACLRRHRLPDTPGRYLIGPGTRWRPITRSDMLKLRDRTEPYSIHYGYWNGDAEVDTPAWLAVELLTKIEQLKTAGKKEWMLALAYARAIGRLEERLFWKEEHENAAIQGYKHRRFIADAGKASAEGRTTKKSGDIQALADILKNTPGLRLDASALSPSLGRSRR